MLKEHGFADGRNWIDDAVVVDRVRHGDKGAFAILYDRHYSYVRSFAFRMSGDGQAADEVAQQAFTRLYSAVRSIRDGRSVLKFLFRTVVNLVRDRAKAGRRKPWIGFVDLFRGAGEGEREVPGAGPDPLDEAVAEGLHSEILRAIRELPIEFRAVIVLHHFEGQDLASIAETLGLPVGTVKSRLGRGRMRLREELGSWLD